MEIDHGEYPSELNCSDNPAGHTSVAALFNQTDPEYLIYQYSYVAILLVGASFGISLNSILLVHLIYRLNKEPRALEFMIIQLSFSHLMVSIFCLLGDGIWNATVQWYGGDALCRTMKYLQMFSLYSATLLLTGMSIEGCITVTFPLTKSSRPDTLHRVRIASAVCWSLAALGSIPQAVIFHVKKAPVCEEFYQCVTHGSYISHTQEIAYTMATLCLMCILPLLVDIVCYVIIFIKITDESKIASGHSSRRPSKSPHEAPLDVPRRLTRGTLAFKHARRVSLWMTFITALNFIISWVPYYIAMFAHLFHWTLSHDTLSSIFCIGMSYSITSPVIFGCFLLWGDHHSVTQHAPSRPISKTGLLVHSRYTYPAGQRSPELSVELRSREPLPRPKH
ncbi:putative Gonadotropin-releasing hormone receptor [Hypsibius exemplaris]|uniref:Gonadotropin-releasing hormone receptor n=1 Tax=Hypsibius exemplaris TaxID=2072580 RepID=A0A1W0XBP6_HYPEX|nr:putative Gonadotropin-releasing hormone receptor [Hypsibius exemplaris]